jgi:carboxyl-terminal processing protease
MSRAAEPPGFLGDTLKDFFEKNKSALTGAAVGMIATIVLVTALFGGFSGLRAAARFASVLRVVRTQYVGEYDINELTEDAMSAVISGLDDNWSYYMDADTYEAYQDYSANRYQGIGVTISKDEETGGFLVVSITKDGPAQTAGMVVGDIILAVDGQSVTEEDASYLRGLIQADYNKQALVTVLRADGQTVDFSVSCEVIYSSPVSYEMLDENVGYVSITNFRQGAGEDAIAAIEDLIDQGAQSLVLDVRSNPGGQVTELVKLLDYLLPEGDIFIRADKRGHEVTETSDASCVEMPMAVLVNGDSYSAAEFFAAALREYDWATVVGEPTTGKARSQVTIPLWDGGAVHLSKYTYLTPQRQDLYEAGGIVPDVEIVLTEEERTEFDTGWLEPADDPQIQAAIAALNA